MNPHYLPTVSCYVRRWSAHRTLCIEFSSIRMHVDIFSNILNIFIVFHSITATTRTDRTVQLIQYERDICVVVPHNSNNTSRYCYCVAYWAEIKSLKTIWFGVAIDVAGPFVTWKQSVNTKYHSGCIIFHVAPVEKYTRAEIEWRRIEWEIVKWTLLMCSSSSYIPMRCVLNRRFTSDALPCRPIQLSGPVWCICLRVALMLSVCRLRRIYIEWFYYVRFRAGRDEIKMETYSTQRKITTLVFSCERTNANTEVQMGSVCHNNERSRYFWWFIAIWIRIQFSVAIFSLSFAQMMSLHWDYFWLVCVERVPIEFAALTPISTVFILAIKLELNN